MSGNKPPPASAPAFLLYLHGFCSSPASAKAVATGALLAGRGQSAQWACPALSPVPNEAIAQAEALLQQAPGRVTVVGSSLGGFYASCLAERHGLAAVLINPAVPERLDPARLLGEHHNFHTGAAFTFTRTHAEQLQALCLRRLTPQRYWVLLERGDEVLDWQDAATFYAGARLDILPGGDHSFTRFAEFLPQILEFAGL